MIQTRWVKMSHPVEGRSFLKTLLGQQFSEEDRPLYFTRREGGTQYGGQCIYALRLGNWKLLQNCPYQPIELYNLKEDPQEKNNVIKQQPEVYKKLNHLLMLHMQAGGRVPWQKPENSK